MNKKSEPFHHSFKYHKPQEPLKRRKRYNSLQFILLFRGNSPVNFFTNDHKLTFFLNPLTQWPKKSHNKKDVKIEELEKETIPSAASIIHANPLGSHEVDNQIAILELMCFIFLWMKINKTSCFNIASWSVCGRRNPWRWSWLKKGLFSHWKS